MIAKLTTRFCLIAGISLIVAGAAILLLDNKADASTAGHSCAFESAKNTTIFAPDTEFTIRVSPFRSYTYKCDGSIGRWWETINSSPNPAQPITGGNAGVLSNDDPQTQGGGTTGGGGVLQ